jgi:hypothetical protein
MTTLAAKKKIEVSAEWVERLKTYYIPNMDKAVGNILEEFSEEKRIALRSHYCALLGYIDSLDLLVE